MTLFDTVSGSSCGYSTEARQKRSSSQTKDKWSRQAPYDFTGCYAHADITYDTTSSNILRIIGYFEHNEDCQNATLVRYPSIPLHEHVYKVALEQLSQGARYVPQVATAVISLSLISSSVLPLSRPKTFGGWNMGSTRISVHVQTTAMNFLARILVACTVAITGCKV